TVEKSKKKIRWRPRPRRRLVNHGLARWTAGRGLREWGSVALPRLGGEKLGEFVRSPVEFLGVGRRFSLARYIWPGFGVVGVQLEPKGKVGLGVRLDRFRRAFGFAHAAVDALVRVNDEHVVALVEAIDRAHLDAVQIFALYAVFHNHIGHMQILVNSLRNGALRHCLPDFQTHPPKFYK